MGHLHCKTHLGESDAGRPQAKPAGNSDLIAAMGFLPGLKHEGNKIFYFFFLSYYITVESAVGAKPRNKRDKNETG